MSMSDQQRHLHYPSSAFTTPTNDNITKNQQHSHLLTLAERAAEAFGCDLRRLLRSATAPKVQHADVACTPGGRRSCRSAEEHTAKTQIALARALADILLEFLWEAESQTANGGAHRRQQNSLSAAGLEGLLTCDNTEAPAGLRDGSSHIARPEEGRRDPPIITDPAASNTFLSDIVLPSKLTATHVSLARPSPIDFEPAQVGPPLHKKLTLWQPAPQHSAQSEEPQTRAERPLMAAEGPHSAVVDDFNRSLMDSTISHVSSLLAAAPASFRPSGASSPVFVAHRFAHSDNAGGIGQQQGNEPHRRGGPAAPPKHSDCFCSSAFVSASDIDGIGGAIAPSAVPQTITMATFLKNVDTTAVSGTSGGAVPLSDFPVEFNATHTARQARTSDSNRWVLNGRYEFISRLGAGGQGSVWRVADFTTGEQRAIKIIPRGSIRRQKLNAAAAARHSAGIGLLAGDISEEEEETTSHASPEGAMRAAAPSAATDDVRMPSFSQTNHRPHSSHLAAAAALDQSKSHLLDGSMLFNHSTDVLRLFYEGGANDGGTLPECLAMEIIMGLFQHPNTIPLYEVIDDRSCNNVFLVMPLAKPLPFSLNLTSGHLTADGPSVETILSYAKAAASALAVFHAAGIVHCDIKLENLLLLLPAGDEKSKDEREAVLAIADFGVCQLSVNSPSQDGHLKRLGGGSGTFGYWAPECFAAKKQSDTFTPASDCYALGLCLYAMTFGQFPYWNPDVMNPLAWEKVIPGTKRYQGTSDSGVAVPQLRSSANRTLLTAVIQGLLAPVAERRMSASGVVELTQ